MPHSSLVSALLGESGDARATLLLGPVSALPHSLTHSLAFNMCHSLASECGASSVFICQQQLLQDSFPLPVLTSHGASEHVSERGSEQAMFLPSSLKRIGLLHPQSSSQLLEQLMEMSFHTPPPQLLVLDGLSALVDTQGQRALSDPIFLQQVTRVLSHTLDLLSHLTARTLTCTSGNSLPPRLVVTENRLRVHGDTHTHAHEERAYWSILERFCERVVLLQSLHQPRAHLSLASTLQSSPLVHIFASSTVTASTTVCSSALSSHSVMSASDSSVSERPCEVLEYGGVTFSSLGSVQVLSDAHAHSLTPCLLVLLDK